MVSEQFGYDLVEKLGRADRATTASSSTRTRTRRRAGFEQRHPRLHQPVDASNAKAYYDTAPLRRPGRGDRHADPALRARRRHLGLDAVVGPVDGALSRAAGGPLVPAGTSTSDDGPRPRPRRAGRDAGRTVAEEVWPGTSVTGGRRPRRSCAIPKSASRKPSRGTRRGMRRTNTVPRTRASEPVTGRGPPEPCGCRGGRRRAARSRCRCRPRRAPHRRRRCVNQTSSGRSAMRCATSRATAPSSDNAGRLRRRVCVSVNRGGSGRGFSTAQARSLSRTATRGTGLARSGESGYSLLLWWERARQFGHTFGPCSSAGPTRPAYQGPSGIRVDAHPVRPRNRPRRRAALGAGIQLCPYGSMSCCMTKRIRCGRESLFVAKNSTLSR